jgi:UDP-N-acetylglucosamine 3-dehydrogenase
MKETIRPINVGVIGCGTQAERHLSSYKEIENVKIKAVCDINLELAKKIGEKFNLNYFNNCTDLIKDQEIDVIDVCVPTPFHHEIVLSALDNNKHVFCEKPLTYKMEYLLEIQKKMCSVNSILMTGYLYNFHPSFIRLKNLLENNILGAPHFAIFRIGGRGDAKIWKHKKEYGGGALFEMAVHMIDLICEIFYPFENIQTIYCDTIIKNRYVENTFINADAEDCVYFRLRSSKGVEIICEADLISPSYMNYVEVHGDNGSYFGSILDYLPTIVYCKQPRGIYQKGKNIFSTPYMDLVKEELNYFINVVSGKLTAPDSITKELNMFQVLEKIQ